MKKDQKGYHETKMHDKMPRCDPEIQNEEKSYDYAYHAKQGSEMRAMKSASVSVRSVRKDQGEMKINMSN